MPTVFEQYAPYRPVMTEEEKAILEDAQKDQEELMKDPTVQFWEHNGRRGFVDKEGKRSNFPLEQAAVQMAMDRADQQFSGRPTFPDAPDITERFPGVDPRGKYCELDMDFHQRMDRLRSALSSRPLEVQSYVGTRLREIQDPERPCGKLYQSMLSACNTLRYLDRAAKVAPSAEVSQWLLEDRQVKASSNLGIQNFNGMLHVLEYLSGLDPTPPTPEQRQLMEKLEAPIEPKVERSRENSLRQPVKLEMTFQNLDNILLQKYHSDPRSWNRNPRQVPSDIANPEAAQQAIARYAAATADRTLDPLFSAMERRTEQSISRGDLIIIDGKTVRERMAEEYAATRQSLNGFGKFYAENVRQKTNAYTAAALMGGKRVEAYVPDKQGRIPKEPVQITKAGYQPSPLKKVTLNAWERHFSRYGFFKEKVAKAAEYERMMAARERVQATNLAAQNQWDKLRHHKGDFFRDWMAEQGKSLSESQNPLGLSTHRTALPTVAICALRSQGYPIEAIRDPDQLQAEKQQMGKEVMRRLEAGDGAWLGQILFDGQQKLLKDIDQMAGSFDFTDEKQLFQPEHRALFFAANALFDASQEAERDQVMPHVQAAADRFAPGYRQQLPQFVDQCNSILTFFNRAASSLESRCALASGLGQDGDIRNLMDFESLRQLYQNQRAATPEKPAHLMCDHLTVGMHSSTTSSLTNQQLDRVFPTPQSRQLLGRAAMEGTLKDRLVFQADPSKYRVTMSIVAPEKKALQQEKRQEALQQQAQKNQAKEAEKPAKQQGGRTR